MKRKIKFSVQIEFSSVKEMRTELKRGVSWLLLSHREGEASLTPVIDTVLLSLAADRFVGGCCSILVPFNGMGAKSALFRSILVYSTSEKGP